MRDLILTPLRLLAAHWPALVAFYVAGVVARYVIIEFAGFVGARSAVGGTLVLCLAIVARLASFVAMFLVVRDGMVRLGALAPLPADAPSRRRAFGDALLGGLLPFTAFYAAWGYLRQDFAAYLNSALEEQRIIIGNTPFGEEPPDLQQVDLALEPTAIILGVVAYLLRWLWKRYRDHAPNWLTPVAVYLETVWLFIAAILISDLLGIITSWVDTRVGLAWAGDFREWLAVQLTPISWIWDGVEWLLGEVGGIVLEPIAWLVIAGVIYGQAVSADAPVLSGAVVDRVRSRFQRIPQAVRRRLGDFWEDLTGRFRPIGRAIVLMWRAGPVLVAGYVLAFTVVAGLQGLMAWGIVQLVGPQDMYTFWRIASPAIGLITLVVMEPIRICVVAAGYDATLARLRPSEPEVELGEPGAILPRDDAHAQGVDGVQRNDEGGDDLVRLGSQ